MPKISPFLWFDTQAEEAAKFYTSVFSNSKITSMARYSKEAAEVSGQPEGSAMTVGFELDGEQFTALNGGPMYKFSEAISFVVNCKDQAEIDHYWTSLTADGGEEGQCGWCKDKFGVSWQIVPDNLGELLSSPAAMQAMLQMKKLVIADLEKGR